MFYSMLPMASLRVNTFLIILRVELKVGLIFLDETIYL